MIGKEYSKEEKISHVENFKESGMSIAAYAREKGIPETTFRGWLRLDRALAFGEIDVKPQLNEIPNTALKPNQPIRKTMVFAKYDIRIELKEGFCPFGTGYFLYKIRDKSKRRTTPTIKFGWEAIITTILRTLTLIRISNYIFYGIYTVKVLELKRFIPSEYGKNVLAEYVLVD